MSTPLQLIGEVDTRDERVRQLEDENQLLRDKFNQAQTDAAALMRENVRAIGSLRRALSPLYAALKQIFGEMDAVAGRDNDVGQAAPAAEARVSKVWEAWKQKLPGMPAKMIDALLVHGEMSSAQLRVAMQCRLQTVYDNASRLSKLGLISKNGGKYSLKQL